MSTGGRLSRSVAAASSMTASMAPSPSAATAAPSSPSSGTRAESPTAATDWVEIIEPRTQEHMFANLTTGECVWDPPAGVPVKKTNDNQWWELFDQNTSRFYYYNATSQKTVWHRPSNCDIIPLAKLQTLKQNTEVKRDGDGDGDDEKSTGSTARKGDLSVREGGGEDAATQTRRSELQPVPSNGSLGASKKTTLTHTSQVQTSPNNSPKAVRRLSHQHRHQHSKRHNRRASDVSDVAAPDRPQPIPHRRFLHNEHPHGSEDKRRTTIGPAQAKYYSVPHKSGAGDNHQPVDRLFIPAKSALSQQNSLEGEQFRYSFRKFQGGKRDQDPAALSRSASFMAGGGGSEQSSTTNPIRRQPQPPQITSFPYSGAGGSSSWRKSLDSRRSLAAANSAGGSGRRASKGSPPSASEANSSPAHSIGSPIEGYCTPLINRKVPPSMAAINSTSRESPLRERMSISELVDTGLNTLTDDNGSDHFQAQHNREKRIGSSVSNSLKKPTPSFRPNRIRRGGGGGNNGTVEGPNKMSPLQQYILEQAKLSGYRFGEPVAEGDRDSYVESEDDWMEKQHEDSDFADDEDGGGLSDDLSKTSSVDGDGEERYLSEPTYNNLDPLWLRDHHSAGSANYANFSNQQHQAFPPVPAPRQSLQQRPSPQQPPLSASSRPLHSSSAADIDAFSQEFDLRMKFDGGKNSKRGADSSAAAAGTGGHSTMPRPASHQPTSSLQHHHHQQLRGNHQQPPPMQNPYQQDPAFPVPYDVLHPSLQRHAHSYIDPATSRINANSRPDSGVTGGSMLSVSASIHSTMSAESDIERYALDNLNVQKRGIFRKKMTVKDILSHTKESIRKPLTCVTDKALKKEAIEIFRLIQIYMGERRAKAGMTINSVAVDICGRGFTKAALRDEIYVQLCKQTTENLSRESLRRGWELLAICLSFFPPSKTFAPALQSYIFRHRDPSLDYPDVGKWPIHVQISHYAGICSKRLERIGEGGRLSPKRPNIDDIDQSRLQIFRPSMFGGTLTEAMEIQADRFPHRRLPWILTTLADQILRLNGTSTEGIFRVPADLDEVNSQKNRVDQWEPPACGDSHTAASLLKMWLRELYEPLIPDEFYEECVTAGQKSGDGTSTASLTNCAGATNVVPRLPGINRDVLTYLVRFLQVFAGHEVAAVTKMDAANLSTVFAPNCLRCQSSDPVVILENTRKEMGFVKSLVLNLDTSALENVL